MIAYEHYNVPNLDVLAEQERNLDEATRKYEQAKATLDRLLLKEDVPEWHLQEAEHVEDDCYHELQAQERATEECRTWFDKQAVASLGSQETVDRMRPQYEKGTEAAPIPAKAYLRPV